MAKDPSTGDLVSDWPASWGVSHPAEWAEPPTEAQISKLWELNEQLDLPEGYYQTVERMILTRAGVNRAIALFEKYGTPK